MNRLLCILFSILLLAGLSACSGGYQSGMEFTYALPQNVDTLDPQTASRQSSFQVIGSIFQGLCGIDDQGEVVPGAARKWDVNEDSTQFTFHLYGDAKWSNGAPVTADDFLFAIQRALRPETTCSLSRGPAPYITAKRTRNSWGYGPRTSTPWW